MGISTRKKENNKKGQEEQRNRTKGGETPALVAVFKEIGPIWIFLIEDFFFLRRKFPRIIGEEIVNLLFIERDKEFTNFAHMVHPIDGVVFGFLVKNIFR